jgi:hypothetical protein
VEISTDGGTTWHTLTTYQGGGTAQSALQAQQDMSQEWKDITWKTEAISLADYSGMAMLRFTLDVDESLSDKGWVLDNVQVVDEAVTIPTSNPLVYLPLVVK